MRARFSTLFSLVALMLTYVATDGLAQTPPSAPSPSKAKVTPTSNGSDSEWVLDTEPAKTTSPAGTAEASKTVIKQDAKPQPNPSAQSDLTSKQKAEQEANGPMRIIPSVSIIDRRGAGFVSTSDPATRDSIAAQIERSPRAKIMVLWLTKVAESFTENSALHKLDSDFQANQKITAEWTEHQAALAKKAAHTVPTTIEVQLTPVQPAKLDVFLNMYFPGDINQMPSLKVSICERTKVYPKICHINLDVPAEVLETSYAILVAPEEVTIGTHLIFRSAKASAMAKEPLINWTPAQAPALQQSMSKAVLPFIWWADFQARCRTALFELKKSFVAQKFTKFGISFRDIPGLGPGLAAVKNSSAERVRTDDFMQSSVVQGGLLTLGYIRSTQNLLNNVAATVKKLEPQLEESEKLNVLYVASIQERDSARFSLRESFCVTSGLNHVAKACRDSAVNLPTQVLDAALISPQAPDLVSSDKLEIQVTNDFIETYNQRLNWKKEFDAVTKRLGD